MNRKIVCAATVFFGFLSLSWADPPSMLDHSHFLNYSYGRSKLILGTTEIQEGTAFSYGFGKRDPHLRYRNFQGLLIHSLMVARSRNTGSSQNETSIAYVARARYPMRLAGPIEAFVEGGWGIQYTDQTSVDLNSHFNSIPQIAVGLSFPVAEGRLEVGVGLFHISNGGTYPPNNGQNFLFFSAGLRY